MNCFRSIPVSRTSRAKHFAGGQLRGPRSDRGIALVITLILLSVITFMAITFLVVSRSEYGSVDSSHDQNTANFAADTALAQGVSRAMAGVSAANDEFKIGLAVSTNYQRFPGYLTAFTGQVVPTNVNDFYPSGKPVVGNDALQNLANLFYLPRVPVYITNQFTRSNDYRFYLDLNRNGVFDPTGLEPQINVAGIQMVNPTNQNLNLSNYCIGDPQWVGVLDRPDFPHSSTNRFVARYAWMIVPAASTLDLNYIHNYAKELSTTLAAGAGDGFLRNEGVGPWEFNLAAFLDGLNYNIWTNNNNAYYQYTTNLSANRGADFDDALSLIRYRYMGQNGPSYRGTISNVFQMFGTPGVNAFDRDGIDGYSAGPLMLGENLPAFDADVARVNTFPWPGADNPTHYFTPSDLFNSNLTSPAFVNRLMTAATSLDTYDRTTVYRLFAQLGTDSAPEPADPNGQPKMNLNYDNLVQSNAITQVISATNFIPWRPIDFFSNAVNRLFASAGYNLNNISFTNIPIYPTNYYTPGVHRLLQLAANMYEASITNQTFGINRDYANSNGYPTVFRPLFSVSARNPTNVYISGYIELSNAPPGTISSMFNMVSGSLFANNLDPNYPQQISQKSLINPLNFVAGVPLIIGAKKGWPNFNKFAMQTSINIERKLEFVRTTNGTSYPIIQTNQMFLMNISNIFGIEAWNSYSNALANDEGLVMYVYADMRTRLTNELGRDLVGLQNFGWFTNFALTNPVGVPYGAQWPGFVFTNYARASLRVPLFTNFMTLTNSAYTNAGRPQFPPTSAGFTYAGGGFFQRPSYFPLPSWSAVLNTRLRFILYDTTAQRIIDYVNLNSWETPLNITNLLASGPHYDNQEMWFQDGAVPPYTGPNRGITNQIRGSLSVWKQPAYDDGFPAVWPQGYDPRYDIDHFRAQFNMSPVTYPMSAFTTNSTFYGPLVASTTINFFTDWEANDPLVHYTIPDLTDTSNPQRLTAGTVPSSTYTAPLTSMVQGNLNHRYQPWSLASSLTEQDPLVTRSDDWNFPANKYPNVGWLGRVHRGTPWQTVYMKSATTNLAAWIRWSGDTTIVTNYGQISQNIVPQLYTNGLPIAPRAFTNDAFFTWTTNDYGLFDWFTATFNDNAGRSQLSVNQTNVAAWSAAFAGLPLSANYVTNWNAALGPEVIQPIGYYNPYDQVLTNEPMLWQVINGINNNRTNFPNHEYQRLGDILTTPELTTASPYLSLGNTNQASDAMYERLPQQTLGMLKCDHTPRFVIYCYGQTLKPATRSIVTSGPFSGLCTNYQVTAETATRAVVRLDKNASGNGYHAVIENFNRLPPD